jgi:hypothetical protein
MHIPVLKSVLKGKGNLPLRSGLVHSVGNSEPATPQLRSLNQPRVAPSTMKGSIYLIGIFLMLLSCAFANVSVSSPSNGSTVGSPVHYAATASTSTCSKGVASMGVYVDNQLVKVVNGTSLNTSVSIGSGKHNTVVEEWDHCGGATYASITITVSPQSAVWVSSPANGGQVGSPVPYAATATTGCSKGVASMGVYVDSRLVKTVNGASLNTALDISAGTHNTVVEEWDYCGGASYTPVSVTVQNGKVLSNLQASGGWKSWGEKKPYYNICSWPCSGVTWSMTQGVTSPSLTGHATRFYLGGTTPYADVLFSNPLIGQGSTQGVPDSNHTLLPTLHNFTYDAYFYSSNLAAAQVLEFDVSMYFNGLSLIWGQQCRIAGGHEWDIWDNINAKWVSTGIACNPVNNGWNHLTIQMQRESDNWLLFQSITLNGKTTPVNRYYQASSAPSSWWGITVNYQMDGNYNQTPYTTFLDDFSLRYW